MNWGTFYCFLAAFIWGTAFVSQKVGGDEIGAISFNTLRACMAAVTLFPIVLVRAKNRQKRIAAGDRNVPIYDKKQTWKTGILCGILLFGASTLQQVAVLETEIGKAGFMTATYVVIVPVMSLFVTRKPNAKILTGAVIALFGLYFLSIENISKLLVWERVDMLLIACAFLFSAHIMCIDRFGKGCDPIEISCIQFAVVFLIGLTPMIFIEHPDFSTVSGQAVISLIYAGVFSSAIAYTFQIVGQKRSDPTVASLVLSLEAMISAISGFFFLHQTLTMREIFGCVLMMAAIVLVQLPGKSGVKEGA